MSTNHKDDLDLLLSLQDRIPETPPSSPSSQSPVAGYNSDDGSPDRVRNADMSMFRDAVKDYLADEDTTTVRPMARSNPSKISKDIDVEKFSGLRIRNLLLSNTDLCNRFSDIRFIRLPAIRNSLVGDSISGSWATVGVLTEKGTPKTSSAGKSFCIWKIGCLDETSVSVFLFGDAYTKHWKESAGTVFAVFNSNVRKDAQGKGFTLSVYLADQMVKMGTSVDYGLCKGKRKDGLSCTMVINKRRGIYCKYHKSKASQKYSTLRTELKGGNLRTAFRGGLKSEGIYLVDPLSDRTNLSKPQPVKVLSVEGLKKALSNAGKVTTNSRSQGIRFLTEVTEKRHPKDPSKVSPKLKQQPSRSEKRSSSAMKEASETVTSNKPEAKRPKIQETSENMIELELVSSDGDV